MIHFEWNETKAHQNVAKHGIDFEQAKAVFLDAMAVDLLDDRFAYGEERWIITARSGTLILTVVYVEGNNGFHIISARKASRAEINDYNYNATL